TTVLSLTVALTTRDRLWQSLLEQARAEREAGNRWQALERIAEASKMKKTPELRQEAIQAITSPGIRLAREVSGGAIRPDERLMDDYLDEILARLSDFDFPRSANHSTPRIRNNPERRRMEVVREDKGKEKLVCFLPIQFGMPETFCLSGDGEWLAFRDRM